MSTPLVLAGCIGVLSAAVHGAAGELLVVRKLSPDLLPPSRLGGPRMTQAMIHVSWHMTTIAFLAIGVALLLAGSALHGDARRPVAYVAASAWTGFAALAVVLGAARAGSPSSLIRHPAPALLSTAAALAWWGALG